MFTGLVAGRGVVVAIEGREDDGGAAKIEIETPLAAELALGDSIAVNGACLSATAIEGSRFSADVVAETLRRTTGRVVLAPNQAALDPGLIVTGELQRFGYDAATGQVIVQYDGSLSAAAGNRVESRRFTATAPADGTAASVGPALNRAANQVALDVAKWIGG